MNEERGELYGGLSVSSTFPAIEVKYRAMLTARSSEALAHLADPHPGAPARAASVTGPDAAEGIHGSDGSA